MTRESVTKVDGPKMHCDERKSHVNLYFRSPCSIFACNNCIIMIKRLCIITVALCCGLMLSAQTMTENDYIRKGNKLYADSLFEKAEVRKALSMAIDRNQIVSIVTYAKAATGYVPYKVFDTATGTSFREVGGDVISASANLSEAQSLLSSAGVTKGSFAITVRNNEVDLAVADYVKGVWEGLGFTVEVEVLGTKKNAEETVDDLFQDAYESGDFVARFSGRYHRLRKVEPDR